MAASGSPLLDLDEALLVDHNFPHLTATELGSLACANKHLQALVSSLDADIWLEAARNVLGPCHSALRPTSSGGSPSTTSLRSALLRYSQACAGLRAGRCDTGGSKGHLHLPYLSCVRGQHLVQHL